MNEFSLGFAFYFAIVGYIAFVAYRRTRTDFDYDLGGRSLSAPVTALSAGASDMSGWLLLGLPGAIYLSGLSEAWIVVGLLIGAFFNWHLVAPKLRRFASTYEKEVATLPQFFSLRTGYHDLPLRIVSSLVVIVFFTVYTSSGFVASAKLFQSTLGWDYQMAVAVGVGVIMVYTVAGGFLAVSWTDTFQAVLMLVALIALPIAALQFEPQQTIELHFTTGGFLASISLLAWGLGYFGQPHILARFMAIKQPAQLGRAKTIAMTWMLLATLGAIGIGLTGAAIVPGLSDEETIFIRVAEILLNPWLAGMLIAAILAAVMSTVDSQLIVASTCIVNDLFRVKQHKLFVSRLVVIGVACGAGVIAFDEESVILDIVAYAWAGLGASFGPAMLFALFWKRTTGDAVVAGMVIGAVTTLVWHNLGVQYDGSIFSNMYEIIPAFLLASIAIALSSYMFPNKVAEERFKTLDELKDSSSDARAT